MHRVRAQLGRFEEKTREARLRWHGHVRRKDDGYIERRMLRMELAGKRKRGRPITEVYVCSERGEVETERRRRRRSSSGVMVLCLLYFLPRSGHPLWLGGLHSPIMLTTVSTTKHTYLL